MMTFRNKQINKEVYGINKTSKSWWGAESEHAFALIC
jgi:hypothetical protein